MQPFDVSDRRVAVWMLCTTYIYRYYDLFIVEKHNGYVIRNLGKYV